MDFKKINIQDLQLKHQLDVNPANGGVTGSVEIPLPTGRADFGPSLGLAYSSSSRNSAFGIGWSLSGIPFIAIDTKKGLPKYDGTDSYAFGGGTSLVPALIQAGTEWIQKTAETPEYWIYDYRQTVEEGFTRFEKWVKKDNHAIHWRTVAGDGVVSVYGVQYGRITNPEKDEQVFRWLLEEQYDNRGNAVWYKYKGENADNVDAQMPSEYHRVKKGSVAGFVQKYPERIVYGNSIPLLPGKPAPPANKWLFEVVFDYGEYAPRPYETTAPAQKWAIRRDPFSMYHPGFEIRTYRLCRRILSYHNIPELSAKPSLTGVFEIDYNESPLGTTIQQLAFMGVKRDLTQGTYTEKALPPLRFTYTAPKPETSFSPCAVESNSNVPQGFNGTETRFADLFGEGLPGILTETANNWYYKRNRGNGFFDKQETVIAKPSQRMGTYALGDFDQDGNLNLFTLQGRTAGYYEYDTHKEAWTGFTPFRNIPQVSNAKFMDVNADGFADLIVETEDKLTCYPFDGKEGFGKPFEFAKPLSNGAAYAPTLGNNLPLDYFMADMTGDGLPDQVRIKNGRAEYFPNLGNGRFGKSVLMEDAPVIDFDSGFDASRIRFFDLDGSGTADLIYLGRGEIRYWYNASGNGFVEGGRITGLPYIDLLSSAQILDLLGDGTPCLVWSNSLCYAAGSAMQYLKLTGGEKPRLMMQLDNGMGCLTQINYGFSGAHYLESQRKGKPWISKIPSHFTVANQRIIIDTIANSRIATTYHYYDGHYNGNERHFVCFGRVEQYDVETQETDVSVHNTDYTQPSCTKTWLHPGLFGWDARKTYQYYRKDGNQPSLPPPFFEHNGAQSENDFIKGYSSLAGKLMRQEVYGVKPDGELEEHPYTVTQTNYAIRTIQPTAAKHHGSCYTYRTEVLEITYDRAPDDPKVTHHLSLEVDEFGNMTKQMSVAYARRNTAPGIHQLQAKDYITVDLRQFLKINTPDAYRTGILYESKSYEVNPIARNPHELLKWGDAAVLGATARQIGWSRTYFWNDAQTAVLPLGQTGDVALAHHDEIACFDDGLIDDAFSGKVTPAMLSQADEGNYIQKDGYWWQRTAINHFNDQSGFYSVDKVEKQPGIFTTYQYDSYFLAIVETTDPLGNETKGAMDYNLIEPCRLTDANDNVSEVLYDALGVPVVATYQGTVLYNGTDERYGHAAISDYSPRSDESFDHIIAHPELYLQNTSTFLYYDLHSIPLRSIRLTNENLLHDGKGNVNLTPIIQIDLDYQDGFGRIIQNKRKVEPGPAIERKPDGTVDTDAGGEPLLAHATDRWLVGGHVVYNNKQLPVRQFEPFHSGTHVFEDDTLLESYGVSIHQYYDAVGRMYRTDFPDATFSETLFTPWEVKSFDQNDTIERSMYKVFKEVQPVGTPERMALDKSLAHKETPATIQFDPLGRDIVRTATNNDGTVRAIETIFDIKGNPTQITDARGLEAFVYKRDMLGRVIYESSMDAGERWSFHNNNDQTIHLWDGRGVHQRTRYDALDRVTQVRVDGALGLNHTTERFVYGEDSPVAQAKRKNLRGCLVIHYDQAGVQELKLAAPGMLPLHTERRLLSQFTSEPDWVNPAAVGLSTDVFTSRYEYDGLGRPIEQQLPDQTTRRYVFNQGGTLQKIHLSTVDGVLSNVEILKSASYDAKGMRQQVLLGNDVGIAYTYDTETFRMKRLRASRTGATPRTYQDIHYTYDPMGNLVHLVDEAQQAAAASPRVMEGLNVSAHSEFEYDALYQLISATGRVHQGLLQNDYADRSGQAGVPADWGKGTRHITLNNGAAVERYTRMYAYDEAGNIKSIKHTGVSQNWTRQIWTSASSNRSLPLLDLNGVSVSNPESRFDAAGNCTHMPHLRSLEWNYRNNIAKAVIIDRSAQGKPNDEEYYVYGGDGMRVRKISQRVVDVANGTVELTEKIYLDGCEIKRMVRGGTEILKRFTSTIAVGDHTIARMHAWEKDTQARETDDVTQKKIHYQLANHLGSSALELDENGDVITYEEYFPYGGTSFIAGRNKRDIDLKAYRYSGKERDDVTGLYYFGYRYYAHWMGGWINPDPIGPEDSENLYLYVHNNPVNVVDPNGLQSTDHNELIRQVFARVNLSATGQEANEYGGITEFFSGSVLEPSLSGVFQTDVRLGVIRDEFGEIIGASVDTNQYERTDLEAIYNIEYGSYGIRPRTTPLIIVEEEPVAPSRPAPTRRSSPRPARPTAERSPEPAPDTVAPEAEREETPPPATPEVAAPETAPGEPEERTAPINVAEPARTVVQESARPTAGSVNQIARQRAGIPRQFTPGEPLQGPYNLWSNEPGGGLADAARRPGYIMEDTVLEDVAEATARRLGYSSGVDPVTGQPYDARYNPDLNWRSSRFNQAHFDDIWHPTSDSLAIRAGTSMTPVTSNGLEPSRTPAHPNPEGTVQMSREIPRIQLAGGLMGQFAKVSGILTIVVSSDIENPYVRTIGMTAGATEFVGGSAYLLGAADLGGGYFGATGASRLMSFGSGAVRVGGGVGMVVLSGYSAAVHFEQGEYGVLVGDAAGVGLGTMVLTNTASGPAVALTGTAMVANYAGDYVESRVTPEYGRGAGIAAGTATGLGVGAVVGGGLVAFGLVSNPVGWGILAVGGIAGLIGAIW
ncbi:MAG TPA: SpvB/TcaC N-terminal domain-containing protein [Parapedobacter sp.]|uniref:SpvB/TcaC N-terminal domain-containing protein n=1 Tax=Parapedobacter sp. TaxID=1958893 RepID=UPI002CB9B3CE|nr:SpvB/TcaC N-terminal domain-containing protein [Parapedobacter sp.]HWK59058.1 SpvB/TcaC N-terminal domain-containing protein [Parapedobacter sp.]